MVYSPVSNRTLPILLAYEGDSQTSAYPAQVATTITQPTRYINAYTGGQNLGQMLTQAATEIDPYIDSRNVDNVCIIWGGTNDIALLGDTGATAYARMVSYCNARRAVGWKVVAVTTMPRTDGAQGATYETQRLALNSSMRANWATFCDALADVGADATLGVLANTTNATYFLADQVHLTTAGYAIVAGLVTTAIRGLGPYH